MADTAVLEAPADEQIIGGELPAEPTTEPVAPRSIEELSDDEFRASPRTQAYEAQVAERIRSEEQARLREEVQVEENRRQRNWVTQGGLVQHLNSQFKAALEAGEDGFTLERVNNAIAAVAPWLMQHDYDEWVKVLKSDIGDIPAARLDEITAAERLVQRDPTTGIPKALGVYLKARDEATEARLRPKLEKEIEAKFQKSAAAGAELGKEEASGEEKRTASRPSALRGSTAGSGGLPLNSVRDYATAYANGQASAADYKGAKQRHDLGLLPY